MGDENLDELNELGEAEAPATEEVVEEQVEAKAPKKAKDSPSVYKGYDIRWLKEVGEDHPDFGLVAEYEAEYGEI